MTELLTAAQMRAIEAAAIASGKVTGLELMERAGQGVVQAIFEEWPELKAGSFRAVVLCGPGNNGGDGFVVARLLREWGWEVEVFLYGTPEGMPPDARVNYERWRALGEVRDFLAPIPATLMSMHVENAGVLVDALFGTGLARPLDADVERQVSAFRSRIPISFLRSVAVDVPSGVDADSGKILGRVSNPPSWATELCVTFHRPRVGHYLGDAHIRSLRVFDIGLAGAPSFSAILQGMEFDGLDLSDELARKARSGLKWLAERPAPEVQPAELIEAQLGELAKFSGHKFSHGHALILSGGVGHGGAARLSARGALRIGAGLVTVACPPDALPENAARLDAVMLKPVADADALAEVLRDDRINALCLGPGLGLDARAADLVNVAVETSRSRVKPGTAQPLRLVLDADALTLISRDPALFALLHENCVLTPHGGEFARLFPDIAAKLEEPATKGPAYSKVDATREAAARAGCVVLFKGADTVIASPDGTCAINAAAYDRAAPWLATAGSGDVLAGFITGLLARGFFPQQAAETGAWLHVECARSFGPGLIAEDLPEELPKVFRALGL